MCCRLCYCFPLAWGPPWPSGASRKSLLLPTENPNPLASRPSAAHHHLLNLVWLLYRQAQQFVSCNLHEEGVENPNLFGVDVPDEGRLFPEALSHLGGWGWEGESQWVETGRWGGASPGDGAPVLMAQALGSAG